MKEMFIALVVLLVAGCTNQITDTNGEPQLPNPASVYCEEQGGTLTIEETQAGQQGICILPNGTECEEWAYYRGECP